MRWSDFASGPGSGRPLQFAQKTAAFPGRRLVVTTNYNRLESDLVFAGSPLADFKSTMDWSHWPAKRSA
jgi:hypothetical protein